MSRSAQITCEACGKNITMSGSQICPICDPDMDAVLDGKSKSPNLCGDCFKIHQASHQTMNELNEQHPSFTNVADLEDPETGKTYRQINNEKTHNIPIGALVEVKMSEWHGHGACEITHARLFVVEHGRDCDGTPLYSLSGTRRDHWDEMNFLQKFDGKQYIIKTDISQRIFYKVHSGYPEESLTVIQVTPELEQGHNSLKWPEEA